MTQPAHPARLPRIRINFSVVRGHYANAKRPRTPAARRDALNTAINDIPVLLTEVERLWTLACDIYLRYADLRAAALATIAAHDTGEPDPLFYLRDELSRTPGDGRRR